MPDLKFKVGDKVVYPSHGVGEIIELETQLIAGSEIKLYVISFAQEKMVLRVPITRAESAGLRNLIGQDTVTKIYSVLKGKAKIGNKMWSRRAQEYETKINSGDVLSIAEVVRDLYKNIDTDRSYSERNIYEIALSRLAKELAILENTAQDIAIEKLIELLRDKVAA
jgi:CarD family transcriptional regulator